ncbi:hypothetical protein [Patulibacter defluvii]|uniref:hypothetical protein n=1 Tax=Patulibacter defluvii TaxID=3095358 RepID=UPI002A75F9C3|nr:hypothetical protein [Patulibacter sp. DM4]
MLAAAGLAAGPTGATAAPFGPLQPPNPFTAPTGAATMHGDSGSSDVTPFAGPGAGPGLSVRSVGLGAACPAIVIGRDERPVALCTRQSDRAPIVHLLDPQSGASLAALALPVGNLFGGVYTYLDQRDRLVLVTGQGRLLRIAHGRDPGPAGGWTLRIVADVDLAPALRAACAGSLCGGVVGLTPDWRGRVWIATASGVAGTVDPASGRAALLRLGRDETVANSISSGPHATAIATTHALYELDVAADGRPRILWRAPYDRGPYRKPGQLSHGTGSTPTYFGPVHGSEYLAIVDNAAPRSRLLVYDALAGRRDRAPRPICRIPVLPAGASGSENSPIGSGRGVIVASTLGYPYPAYPDDAGPIGPDDHDGVFAGGMTRVDVDPDGRGCHEVWTNAVRSAAVPKLSLADGLVYTTVRSGPLGGDGAATTPLDRFAFAAIDAASGRLVGGPSFLGATLLNDTLQLAGNAAPRGGVYWQGSVSGVARIGDGRVTTPAYARSGTLEPDAANGIDATAALTRCVASGLALSDVRRTGPRVRLRGAATASGPLRVVRRDRPGGRARTVATTAPAADGRVALDLPAPRARRAAYRLVDGTGRASAWLGLRRRAWIDDADADGARIAVRGHVRGDARRVPVRLERRDGCGSWTAVARGRLRRDGRFALALAAPAARDALLLRVRAGRATTAAVAVRPR